MRLLEYIEVENFKRFGSLQRVNLDHPAVLIGPNNSGKTSLIQALALWSQGLKTWWDAKGAAAKKKHSKNPSVSGTALNRLAITAVPVQKTRFFWHNTQIRSDQIHIAIAITVGVARRGGVKPVKMLFRHLGGDELVYCEPDVVDDGTLEALEHASQINIELLYPMSGLTIEEPIVKPGRLHVLLGQGETAQVLRNLCLMVHQNSPDDWRQVVGYMRRLFHVDLGVPEENARGSIDLSYLQSGVRTPLDVSMSGRGFQQMLLLFAYLFSHKRSILMIDEPDAHLEILRQKQVYILLRDIALRNESQVIIVTHSEVILDEALDHNLTLLLEGQADNLAEKKVIRDTLRQYGAEHYVKAKERGYVFYVEGSTDVDMLRALAVKTGHPVAEFWDERINVYYTQNIHDEQSVDSELERVENGFGVSPQNHFHSLRKLIPDLSGVGILDNDGRDRVDSAESGLIVRYWKRYEAENYFITPGLLEMYALKRNQSQELFDGYRGQIRSTMEELLLEKVFDGNTKDLELFRAATPDMERLIWESKTAKTKLSDFAEEYFRRLSRRIGQEMLLRKGELHSLIDDIDAGSVSPEVGEKLDLLLPLFQAASCRIDDINGAIDVVGEDTDTEL